MSKRISIDEILNKFTKEFHERYGDDAVIEEDETFTIILNNCVVTISNKADKICVDVSGSEPFYFDNDCDMFTDDTETEDD